MRAGLRRAARAVIPHPVRRAILGATRRGRGGRRGLDAVGPPRKGPGDPAGIHRLQVGCGPTNLLPDWWNVDVRAFPGIDEVMDVTRPWPWRNLEFVYGEHFLEHLPTDGAIAFVQQAAAAIAPGGILRLSTPSLEHVWVTHFTPAPGRDAASVVAETYRANRAFHGWGHRFLYSKPMLERLLAAAGFRDLSFHVYGASEHPALQGIERHQGWDVVAGWPSVWIIEGVASGIARAADLAELEAEMEEAFGRYVRSGH